MLTYKGRRNPAIYRLDFSQTDAAGRDEQNGFFFAQHISLILFK